MSASVEPVKLQVLEEAVRKIGRDVPHSLRNLLVNATSLSGKAPDAPDKDLRAFIYRSMFYFLARENEIGGGSSLIYPPEIVATIRQLYPGDIKDYPPQSRKRKMLYEVSLEELVEVYHEKDLRDPPQETSQEVGGSERPKTK